MIPTHKSLLDCISVRLKDMDIWTATRVSDGENGECSFKKDEKSLLVKPVLLDLKVERNLEQTKSRKIPDMAIKGDLSRAYFKLDQRQFWIVRSFFGS